MKSDGNLNHNRPILFGILWVMLPAIMLGWLLLHYGVNVPFWDQWTVTGTLVKTVSGQISISDLLAQHNESRKFFPRLIFIALAHLSHYDVRYELLVSFVMTALTSLNFYYLGQKTVKGSIASGLFLLFFANLLIFSPVQYEAWLIGLSSVVFLSLACLSSSFAIAYSSLNLKLKFILCGLLATISTFSFANGLFSWFLILPVLLIAPSANESANEPEKTQRRRLVLGWVLAFGINVAIYFYNYSKPTGHPNLDQALITPNAAIAYFLAFLGNPLAWGTEISPPALAQTLGFLFLLGLLGLVAYLIRFRRDHTLWSRSMPWLMFALYAVFSAAVATIGRLGFGVEQALTSRYTTFAIYLMVALLYLGAIVLEDAGKKRVLRPKIWGDRLATATLSFTICLYSFTAFYSVNKMFETRQSRLQGKTCVLLINTAPDSECIAELYFGGVEGLKPLADSLNQIGWMSPPLLQTNRVQDILGDRATSGEYGWLEQAVPTGGNQFDIKGWAVLPTRKSIADSVLLTYDNANGDSVIFRVFEVRYPSPDMVQKLKNSAYGNARWNGTFSLAGLPIQKGTKIKAWAFDVNQAKAYQLNGLVQVQ